MATMERAPQRAPGDDRASIVVLVADDELGTTLLVSDVLTWAGFTVVQAFDGLQALARAREHRPHIALLDVMMPGMDGREVCRRIREDRELAGMRIVLHSSADEQDIAWRDVGADAFLQKPFGIRDLPDFLRRLLATR